jgi:hypothetical protein
MHKCLNVKDDGRHDAIWDSDIVVQEPIGTTPNPHVDDAFT